MQPHQPDWISNVLSTFIDRFMDDLSTGELRWSKPLVQLLILRPDFAEPTLERFLPLWLKNETPQWKFMATVEITSTLLELLPENLALELLRAYLARFPGVVDQNQHALGLVIGQVAFVWKKQKESEIWSWLKTQLKQGPQAL